MVDSAQAERIGSGQGFFAALDQSGGSTPKALQAYGIEPDEYHSDEEMFDLVHRMRARVISAPCFTGDKVLGAILFEQTMDRQVEGRDTAAYLWEVKRIVPFVKVDQGLADKADGVQLMKEMTRLDSLLERAVAKRIFGTKMRSVVWAADPHGIDALVEQQFQYAARILAAGLVPILEPEVDIEIPDKAQAEDVLKTQLRQRLDDLPSDTQVMLKLSIPTQDGFYSDLIGHPRVLRVVALSGGYSRDEADGRLARNPGLIASFSRALLEGLSAKQSDAEFDATLRESVDQIYAASTR